MICENCGETELIEVRLVSEDVVKDFLRVINADEMIDNFLCQTELLFCPECKLIFEKQAICESLEALV